MCMGLLGEMLVLLWKGWTLRGGWGLGVVVVVGLGGWEGGGGGGSVVSKQDTNAVKQPGE